MTKPKPRLLSNRSIHHAECRAPYQEKTVASSTKRNRRRRSSAREIRPTAALHLLCLWLLAAGGCVPSFLINVVVAAADSSLYTILGVTQKATTKEIKQAYRRKALLTHPDKQRGVPPEEAAEAFRKVVEAFEVLSDDSSRKRYDRTGKTDGGGGGFGGNNSNSQQQQWQQRQQYQWNWYTKQKPLRMKDRFDVKQAQSRVLHVVSLSQLQTIMLDDDERLERNLLLCFVTPLSEKVADEEIVFPYPFAHMSSQGIWWEDLLQTVQIKFYRNSELSQFFGASSAEVNKQPLFIFAPRGTKLTPDAAVKLPRLHTKDRQTFEEWVWKRIEITVEFVNRHDHEVEVYWIHGSRAHITMKLQPGATAEHLTMLSHEWYFRDARVDMFPSSPGRYKLSEGSSLGSVKILSDTDPQRIEIPRKTCYDMSGHCSFWQGHGECRKNPTFMAEQCRKTCNLCTEDDDKKKNNSFEEEL
jgi:hypothetical protein